MGSSLRNAMTIQLFASIVALVFSLLAFLTSPSLPIFAPLLTIGLLGIFVTTAPLCTLIYPLCMPSFDLGSSLLLTNQISLLEFAILPRLPLWWHADAVSMWTVPVPMRPVGQAFQIIIMHLFGDVPSPPIIGAIQGTILAYPF